MESLVLSHEDAGKLFKLLSTFINSRVLLIQQGSLKRDDVSVKWSNELVWVHIGQPKPKDHQQEG